MGKQFLIRISTLPIRILRWANNGGATNTFLINIVVYISVANIVDIGDSF
jgi:hypothetical protein